jgi:ribosome biogenesis GTPase
MLKGTVTSVTRRFITVSLEDGKELDVTLARKFTDVALGDSAVLEETANGAELVKIEDRHSIFQRASQERTKVIAVNVDHLFVVSAVAPLFNTVFIDRAITAATLEEIPITLVVNKIDLGVETTCPVISIYEKIEIPVLYTSAKEGIGLDKLLEVTTDPSVKIAVLSGISGVGKSTIINRLFPDKLRKTGEVSSKTGQGKQTTSEAYAFRYEERNKPLFIVDIPGIQQFGLSYLEPQDVGRGFKEIFQISSNCAFRDCLHVKESRCAVLAALESGAISKSRYESYINILSEVQTKKRF